MRDKLLERGRPRYATIRVPDIGDVRVRSLSARETFALADRLAAAADKHEEAAIYIQACAVDDDGQPLFGDDDLETLINLEPHVTNALYSGILRHVGLMKGEAVEKNSDETP